MSKLPAGADIEILERASGDLPVVVPNAVRINGTEILIPEDARIQVHEITASNVVTVTLTVFARSVSIRQQPLNEGE